MSTRATYHFKPGANDCYRPGVTIYIHSDGYEDGAAQYFYNAIAHGGPLLESFIRGNDRAEITGKHETHGDTEYRYDVSYSPETGVPILTARKRTADEWSPCYLGPLADFILRHPRFIRANHPELPEVFVVQDGARIRTPAALLADLKRHFDDACRAYGQGWIGNACGSIGMAERLLPLLVFSVPEARALVGQVERLGVRLKEAMAQSQQRG